MFAADGGRGDAGARAGQGRGGAQGGRGARGGCAYWASGAGGARGGSDGGRGGFNRLLIVIGGERHDARDQQTKSNYADNQTHKNRVNLWQGELLLFHQHLEKIKVSCSAKGSSSIVILPRYAVFRQFFLSRVFVKRQLIVLGG